MNNPNRSPMNSIYHSTHRACLRFLRRYRSYDCFFNNNKIMAEFTLDEQAMKQVIDLSMKEWARVGVDLIVKQTPRDRKRPPKPIGIVGEKKPEWRVVTKWWYYYAPVTGALKSSIGYQKSGSAQYDLWVKQWPASSYARLQEFGGVHVPPRSYIRKWFNEWIKEIMNAILFTFQRLTR